MNKYTFELHKHYKDKEKAKNMTFKLKKADGLSYNHKIALDDIFQSLKKQLHGLEKQLKKEGIDMKKYMIDYQNGLVDEIGAINLDDAMDQVMESLTHTQNSIKILDECNNHLATLPYYGYDPSIDDDLEEDDILVAFGDFGFYSNWIIQ